MPASSGMMTPPFNVGVLFERRFDFAKLYPVAVYFYLMIQAAEELQHAAGLSPDQIAGAIYSRAGLLRIGIRHEMLTG